MKMNDHYYTGKPKSRLKVTEFTQRLRGNPIHLYSGSGVFSIGQVDKGTLLLIENASVEDGWDILDLGCGYGPVGISIAKAYPNARVLMSDVNSRAVGLAKKGIARNGLSNITAVQSDAYDSIDGNFDTILLNPPQNAGKEVCHQMIEGSLSHLKPGGLLQLVARHSKGGKSLSSFMEEVFGNLEVTAKGSGYRIYASSTEKTQAI